MSNLRNASIDLTQLQEILKNGHSAVSVSEKNGHTYLSIQIWDKDQPDQYGQDVSIKLNSTKVAREAGETQPYIGNGKKRQQ
jgi:hypothetical protein